MVFITFQNGVTVRLAGIKDELSHIAREMKKLNPEIDKVRCK